MAKVWQAQRASNIALIKYMGKKDVEKNIPTNSSISWTLDHLVTIVTLEENQDPVDIWIPLESDYPFEMSETGLKKYLGHFQRIKEAFGIEKNFIISSANNFPADCGIASSASSFAALTEVSCQAFSEMTGKKLSTNEKAMLSAKGSGSSCRSFLPGLVEWNESGVVSVDSELKNILHMVVLVGKGAKKVSSSQAHKMVKTSALFNGRVARCDQRLSLLKTQIQPLDWKGLYQNIWAEFWDMHAMFETSEPSFGYFLPGTIELLEKIRNFWEVESDGPVVTMDAGPNIHLLWRENQSTLAQKFFDENLKNKWTALSNLPEVGFAQV